MMRKFIDIFINTTEYFLNRCDFGMKGKLIIIFIAIKVIPLILLSVMAWQQIVILGNTLKDIAVSDSVAALNLHATENIERMTTDTAKKVAEFLYGRDSDILYIAGIEPSEENYRHFLNSKVRNLVKKGKWEIAPDGKSWISVKTAMPTTVGGFPSNSENNDMNGFRYRQPDIFQYEKIPLYDEITFVDREGNEQIKVVAQASPKINYPMNREKRNIAKRENTYVKAETYFDELKKLEPGEIYVSDVIGAYVGSNYIGIYTPQMLAEAEKTHGYKIEYDPANQAYAGRENPYGKRFEGIVRWATPVTDKGGNIIGYTTFALNHDHIMEFADYITPMEERYTELPSAYDGNYAFIWDYKCRSIVHPRHHSIVGVDPATGDPQVPWLEESVYNKWKASGIEKWSDFVEDLPIFDEQSRDKKPASALTQKGLVGLDGRYLNNAPQCTGWMDLTENGGSGSFYILWSGLYKLTTAAAIPYYTGHYAPSEANNFSGRGFGFVAVGAGLEDFTQPARATGEKLAATVNNNIMATFAQLTGTTAIIIVLVILIAIWMASFFTDSIMRLSRGISRFKAGERQFRFNLPIKDEFDALASSFDDMADSIEESVKNPLCIIDMDLKIVYMNNSGLKLRKKTLPEIVGTSYLENSIYPAGSEFSPIKALAEGREAEVYYVKDRKMYVKGVANYLLDKSGKKTGYVIVTTDVTEIQNAREKAEQASKTKSDFLSSMSHEMRTPMLVTNAKTEVEYISNSLLEWFDLDNMRHALNRPLLELPASGEMKAMLQEVMENEGFVQQNFELTIDGKKQWFMLRSSQMGPDKNARVFEWVNITQLMDAKNDAEVATKAKNDFFAKMSHEMRTPMNAIAGMSELILRESIPPLIREHALNIKQASDNLLLLINDILDLSKIESGKFEIVCSEYLLASLINDVTSIIRVRIIEKPIQFTVNVDCNLPNRLIGDEIRLRQILLNLLGNSVKYTSDGVISFTVTGSIKDDTALLKFEISDSGIGIKKEDLGKLFENFVQLDLITNKNIEGTGLGLAISKSLCQTMDGDIEVRSEYGAGSTFTVTIPQKFNVYKKFASVDNPDDKRVLIYEPSSTYANSIARTIRDLGVRCVIADKRSVFHEELISRPYNFVFLASSLLKEVRHILKLSAANAKLILITEVGEAAAARNTITLPMPAHPLSIANILNDVADNTDANNNYEMGVWFTAPAARVLIVDDINTNLKVAQGLMSPYNMTVDTCLSGQAAVESVKTNKYDIIFMDHMMPLMDGVETTGIIRALPDESGYFKNVPIIALTANAVAGVKEMFLQNGFNDFLAKPVESSKLNAMLERWIPKEKREKYQQDTDNMATVLPEFEIEGINVKTGLLMTGGTLDNYLQTLNLFCTECFERMPEIRDFLKKNDIKLFTICVHGIKSAAASVGAAKISDFAQKLEFAGSEENIAFIHENSANFLDEMELLLKNIDAALANFHAGQEEAAEDREFLCTELLKLKKAFEDDPVEINDILNAIMAKKWDKKTTDNIQNIYSNFLLYEYEKAIELIELVLKEECQS